MTDTSETPLDGKIEKGATLPSTAGACAQANLVRRSKFFDKGASQTPPWQLHLFFRILREAEVAAISKALKAMTPPPMPEKDTGLELSEESAQPSPSSLFRTLSHTGSKNIPKASRDKATPPPATGFRNWLAALVNGDEEGLSEFATAICETLNVDGGGSAAFVPKGLLDSRNDSLAMAQVLKPFVAAFAPGSPEKFQKAFNEVAAAIRAEAVKGPAELAGPANALHLLLVHEMLRVVAPAFLTGGASPTELAPSIRSDSADRKLTPGAATIDNAPINIAFTYSGLRALEIHPTTLSSFPDPFREGMAARAARLSDTGENAPEGWEGELGLESVHGYFTASSKVLDDLPTTEAFWADLRLAVRAFNAWTDNGGNGTDNEDNGTGTEDNSGLATRAALQFVFLLFGMELVHVELGQDPYAVEEGLAKAVKGRVEHFGFRDGLSQPYVELGDKTPKPGGGTPSRAASWSPVAAGEIFLDQKDEDGDEHCSPLSKQLRMGGTYVVFRKLEQNLSAFRAFLRLQHPNDKKARKRLAAQFVGRWKNGVPLVQAPRDPGEATPAESHLNDFRYASDDPHGEKCPLGAHIRRTNPRDIGGRGDVRRHRLLRRGMSYGGKLLKGGEIDEEPRGLLFVAFNARIDLQFEVIQGDWINNGEFLGQSGLDRCPLTGANAGKLGDRFLSPGSGHPVTGIPQFVTLRGGDYFFAPGVEALRILGKQGANAFAPDEKPFGLRTLAAFGTPGLFTAERFKAYAAAVAAIPKKEPALKPTRVALPCAMEHQRSEAVTFVSSYEDVKEVLSAPTRSGHMVFPSEPYRIGSMRIVRGGPMIVGTEPCGPTEKDRLRLTAIMEQSWKLLDASPSGDVRTRIATVVNDRLERVMRRIESTHRVDLAEDFAGQAAYAVLNTIYGVAGPPWVTELALSLGLGRQHVSELPPQWPALLKEGHAEDPGLTTMRAWAAIIMADLVGNVEDIDVLHRIARQAGAELVNHLDGILEAAAARRQGGDPVHTWMDAFAEIQDQIFNKDQRLPGTRYTKDRAGRARYAADVAALMAEFVGSTLAVIPMAFASTMQFVFEQRIDISRDAFNLTDAAAARAFIYEADRLKVSQAVRLRRCRYDTTLPSKGTVYKHDLVGAVVAAANLDEKGFGEPLAFKPGRPPGDYLMFGVSGTTKECWGRDRVAMPVLTACMAFATRLQGLRPVAGPKGAPVEFAGVTVGLPARFSRVKPAPKPAKPEAPSGQTEDTADPAP